MATRTWEGNAPPVAQVTTIQITADDASTTYTITINGHTISVAGSGTGVNDTATALQAALDASSHPYFAQVTWTVSTDTVTGTAGTAGAPFTCTSSVAGGTGTIGAATEATASEGPHDWSTAENWSGDAVPTTGDAVIIGDTDKSILWGLDQNAVALTSLRIMDTFTGQLGHSVASFTTSADGSSVNTAYREYREDYLKIDSDVIHVGEPAGGSGSALIKIDNGEAGASTNIIYKTATSSADSGAACRIKTAHASAEIFVINGTVGIASEPGETATVGDIRITPTTTGCAVDVGAGVTVTNARITSGTLRMQAAATVTALTIDGGTVTSFGDGYWFTTVEVNGGTYVMNHWHTSSAEVITLNLNGGTVDVSQYARDRTITTVNQNGGSLIADDDILTITTLNQPSGLKTIAVS